MLGGGRLLESEKFLKSFCVSFCCLYFFFLVFYLFIAVLDFVCLFVFFSFCVLVF